MKLQPSIASATLAKTPTATTTTSSSFKCIPSFDYGYHDEPITTSKIQVPWDPGGSTWRRLEVKPKIKEGGMLATSPALAWDRQWAITTGLGLLGSQATRQLQIQGIELRTTWLGTGRLRPPLLLYLLPLVFLSSVMARPW